LHKVDIPYKDYFNDDKPAIATFYFNINAFELAEIAVMFDGDLGEYMRRSFGTDGNFKDGFKVLKLLFIRGYGRRELGTDGVRWRFIKKPEWIAELLPSPEFEAFYLKLTDDAEFSSAFWNGLVSEELLKRAKLLEEGGAVEKPAEGPGDVKFRDLSIEDQFKLFQTKLAEKKPANEITA
jgi:hypothetical protein